MNIITVNRKKLRLYVQVSSETTSPSDSPSKSSSKKALTLEEKKRLAAEQENALKTRKLQQQDQLLQPVQPNLSNQFGKAPSNMVQLAQSIRTAPVVQNANLPLRTPSRNTDDWGAFLSSAGQSSSFATKNQRTSKKNERSPFDDLVVFPGNKPGQRKAVDVSAEELGGPGAPSAKSDINDLLG